MANVHLQEAATNIRRAINDLKQMQQELKATIDRQVHDRQEQQNTIKTQESTLRAQMNNNDQTAQTQGAVLIMKLEKEHSDISKHINEIRGEVDRQIRSMNNQIAQYESMARQLETST